MALYYVNDSLITDEMVGESSWPSGETYKRYMIRSIPFLKKMDDGSMIEQTRPICAHNCSDDPSSKTRVISVIHEGARTPKVTVRTSTDTRYESDIFVVAIPYDGLIKPIDHDEKALSIFKTLMIKSDRMSIAFEDRKYKRVAYFVCRPDYRELGQDGWYSDACSLKVTFAQSNKTHNDQPDEEVHWTFKTVTVRFGADGMYEISSAEEIAPFDTFNPDDIKSVPICNVVQPTVISENDQQSNRGGKRR